MSDTLIAQLGVIVGVITGGILTGAISFIQIRHQTKEARKDRRVRARESYLIPLRQALSKYMNMSFKGYSAYAVLKDMQEKGAEAEKQKEPFKTMMDSLDSTSVTMSEIEILSGQTSDTKLRKMILDIKNQQTEIEPIIRNYSKQFANIKDIAPANWNDFLRQYNTVVSDQLNRLIPINKRIEDLLCGEEDT